MQENQLAGLTRQQIKIFLAAAKHQNLSRAAEELFIAEPSVSRSISSLEANLGITLFTRQKKKIALTSAGEYLFKRLSVLSNQLDQAFAKAEEIQRAENVIFRIGDFSTQGASEYLFPRLSFFQKKYPQVEVLMEQADYDALEAGLVSNRYNVIFAPMYMRNLFAREDTTVVPAIDYRPYIVISRYHYLFSSDSVTWRDFLGDTAVMLKGKNYELYDRMAENVFREIVFRGRKLHQAKSTLEMAAQLLHDHRFLIGNLLFSPIDKNEYRTIPLPESIADNWGVDLIYRSGDEDPVLQAFAECFHSGKRSRKVVH